jgi:putative nucleotide binding protein
MSERDQNRREYSSRSQNQDRRGPRGFSNGGRPGGKHDGRPPHHRPDYGFLTKGSTVYVLDILQHGGVDRHSSGGSNLAWQPVCQVIQTPNYNLFEIALTKGEIVSVQQKIVLTGETSPLGKIQRRLKFDELTPTSKDIIQDVLEIYVKESEQLFIKFINSAGPITIKRHSLEVLPGIGKKIMWDIITEREKAPFQNYTDLKKRVPGLKIEEIIAKRIVEELSNPEEKHYLFVRRSNPSPDHHDRPFSDAREHSPSDQREYSPRSPQYPPF